MNIWIINHYAMPPEYEVRVRNNKMAKYLQKLGYNVKIISASTIHNSSINLMDNINSKFIEKSYDGLNFVHIKTSNYNGNGIKRILNHLQFLIGILLNYKKISTKPDIIICNLGIPFTIVPYYISQKVRAKFIFEVRDLWPKSFVAYGIISRKNPLLRLLYAEEKWIYKNADKLVFTMEGGRDYILEQGWDKLNGGPVDINKVCHINNGVDLEAFNYNREHYQLDDEDLNNSETFKVIYTGSIRLINKVEMLVDVAKIIQEKNIIFLIWGDGDQVQHIKNRIKNEDIRNIALKGKVDKKYIPYITSKADINIILGTNNPLYKYGVSANKMFDYFASGKPIISAMTFGYSLIKKYNAGVELEDSSVENICKAILDYKLLSSQFYEEQCNNALKAAEDFDFKILTDKLEKIILELLPEEDSHANPVN